MGIAGGTAYEKPRNGKESVDPKIVAIMKIMVNVWKIWLNLMTQIPPSVLKRPLLIVGAGLLASSAARAGDTVALDLVAHEAAELGVGIVNLLHLYSPERVVLGGGVSSGFDLLHPDIKRHIRSWALPPFRDVPVVAAALGQNSGVVGAACLVLPG